MTAILSLALFVMTATNNPEPGADQAEPDTRFWHEPCGPVCDPHLYPFLEPYSGLARVLPGPLFTLAFQCYALIERQTEHDLPGINDYQIAIRIRSDRNGDASGQPERDEFAITFEQRYIARQYFAEDRADEPLFTGYGASGATPNLHCRAVWNETDWRIIDARMFRTGFQFSDSLMPDDAQE